MAFFFFFQAGAQAHLRLSALGQTHQKGGAIGHFLAGIGVVAFCALADKDLLALIAGGGGFRTILAHRCNVPWQQRDDQQSKKNG